MSCRHCISAIYFFINIISCAFATRTNAQANRVFEGFELMNFGVIDVSSNNQATWSTQRYPHPGYFSVAGLSKYVGYSNLFNIDGYIKKYGNTSFVFPVGTGKQIRTLEISKPETPTDAYATAWLEGDPSNYFDPTEPYIGKHSVHAVHGLIASVSKVGQWDWQVGAEGNLGAGTSGSGNNINITVSIPDMTGFAEATELRLVGWNGSGWVDLSGKATATGNRENSLLTGTMIPGISAIAIGKTACRPFVSATPIAAISSLKNERSDMQIYPNPIVNNDKIHLRLITDYEGEADLVLLNSIGQVLLLQTIQIHHGLNILTPDMQNLIQGSYYFQLIGSKDKKLISIKSFIKT